ncbi:MAG TPA: SDR family NAD(P)-dependent oxidoreductase [Sphingobium sp.]
MGNSQRRVAVVTGASSGIGRETARTLASQGWHVIGIGRDPGRCADAAHEIAAASRGGGAIDMLRADLSLLREARRVAEEVAALTDRIDVLVNNAGGIANRKIVTDEGNDENFASNHLGPFVLTNRLLPLLRRTAGHAPKGSVRIVMTSSDASEMAPDLIWDDLQLEKNFNPGVAYVQAKLANSLFASGLATRLEKDGVIVHAVHPGAVRTNFSSHADADMSAYLATIDAVSPAEGADTLIWLATADEPGETTGGYYFRRQPRAPNPLVHDRTAVDRLWEESEKIVGLTQ